MAEIRVATTSKVNTLISENADLLEQHGISAGLQASRPASSGEGKYYFGIDSGIWSRDNGTSWDEVSGLSEVYIQGLIDDSIVTHAEDGDAHHTAPTYDGGTDEVVFDI
jgi:hypothetical protein